jgi:hypothetical protein
MSTPVVLLSRKVHVPAEEQPSMFLCLTNPCVIPNPYKIHDAVTWWTIFTEAAMLLILARRFAA